MGVSMILAIFVSAYILIYLNRKEDEAEKQTSVGLKKSLGEALDHVGEYGNGTFWSNQVYSHDAYPKFKEEEVFYEHYLSKVMAKKQPLMENLVRLNSSLAEKANYFDDISFTIPTLTQGKQIFLPVYQLVTQNTSSIYKFTSALHSVQEAYQFARNITDFPVMGNQPSSQPKVPIPAPKAQANTEAVFGDHALRVIAE